MSASVSSKPSTALATIQPSESRLWVTPFAGPVLPDVKKMAAGASVGVGRERDGSGILGGQSCSSVGPSPSDPSSADLQQSTGERAGGEVVGPLRVRHDRAGAADLSAWSISACCVAVVEGRASPARRGSTRGSARAGGCGWAAATRSGRPARARAPRSCAPDGRSPSSSSRHVIWSVALTTATASGSRVEPDAQQVAQIHGRVEHGSFERHAALLCQLRPVERSSQQRRTVEWQWPVRAALSYGADPWGLTSTEAGCS